jgi:hypothetical protein
MDRLKQLGTAVYTYMQDWDSTYPPMQTPAALKKALHPYVRSDDAFFNPRTRKPYLTNPSLSRKRMNVVRDPANLAMIYEDAPSEDGSRGILYADAHARRIHEADWPRLMRASHLSPAPAPKAQPAKKRRRS